tara:strand:- start:174 stop:440 length:267 start_codon:yes stop_codon:yes gene_type:complete
MQRTKIIGTIVGTPTNAGSASSISSATCVRLFNNTSGVTTVSISTSVGAATTVSFSMPQNQVEFLEKLPTDVIYTSVSIQANQVGFTN